MSGKKKILGKPTSIYLHETVRQKLKLVREHYEDVLGVPISTSWLINRLLSDSMKTADEGFVAP